MGWRGQNHVPREKGREGEESRGGQEKSPQLYPSQVSAFAPSYLLGVESSWNEVVPRLNSTLLQSLSGVSYSRR